MRHCAARRVAPAQQTYRGVDPDEETAVSDSLVNEFRQRHGLGEEFDREVIRTFRESVLDQFRLAFEIYLRNANLDWDDFGAVLGIHRGTISRWIRGEIRPELDTIHLYIAARNIPIVDIGFPDGSDAVLGGLARTLEAIRSRITKCGPQPIDKHETEALRFVMSHPRIGTIGDGERGNRVLGSIVNELIERVPHSRASSPQSVSAILEEWFIPWILLVDAVPYGWIHYRYED
jgi:transcriptional regulator with XRE-family HTH domain